MAKKVVNVDVLPMGALKSIVVNALIASSELRRDAEAEEARWSRAVAATKRLRARCEVCVEALNSTRTMASKQGHSEDWKAHVEAIESTLEELREAPSKCRMMLDGEAEKYLSTVVPEANARVQRAEAFVRHTLWLDGEVKRALAAKAAEAKAKEAEAKKAEADAAKAAEAKAEEAKVRRFEADMRRLISQNTWLVEQALRGRDLLPAQERIAEAAIEAIRYFNAKYCDGTPEVDLRDLPEGTTVRLVPSK